MKRIVCSIFLGVVILSGAFALTNGEYIRNIALLVSRWEAWDSQLNSFWNLQFNTDGQYIGSGSYEDYVYQTGMYCGISKALSESIDKCIALNLRMVVPESYIWLTEKNSDMFYRTSQKTSWYYGLPDESKKIYDSGYFVGNMMITGESARLPSIWEYHY